MKTPRPYKPRRRRDPQIAAAFWAGVYRAVIVGLFAGLILWGLLLLGGAPLIRTRATAALSVLVCGLIGALLLAAWEWGRRTLALTASEVVTALGRRLEFLIWPFVGESETESETEDEAGSESQEDQDRAAQVEHGARGLAQALLAPLVGIPMMAALLRRGQVRSFSARAVSALAVLGAALWIVGAVVGWRWLKPAPPPPPAETQVAAQPVTPQTDPRYDSVLELAVAKARMAKDEGNTAEAITLLEQALSDVAMQGRDVSHPELHRNLAWLYAEEGNINGAIVMFETVLRLVPEGSVEWREAQGALTRLSLRSSEVLAPVGTDSTLLDEDAASGERAAAESGGKRSTAPAPRGRKER